MAPASMSKYRIKFDYQPAEKATRFEPGCEEKFTINSVAMQMRAGTWIDLSSAEYDDREMIQHILDAREKMPTRRGDGSLFQPERSMKWAVDFPSRIRGRPWLQYTVTAETADEAERRAIPRSPQMANTRPLPPAEGGQIEGGRGSMINAIKAGWLAWLAAQKKKQIAFLENSRREALYQIEDMKTRP